MQVKCPNCGSVNIYNIYSGENIDEDISCGINIVKYDCECEECGDDFECVVHYAVADVSYV